MMEMPNEEVLDRRSEHQTNSRLFKQDSERSREIREETKAGRIGAPNASLR